MSDTFHAQRGQTFRIRFNWVDETEAQADLTGYTASIHDPGEKLSALVCTIADAPTGQLELYLPFVAVDDLPEKKEAGQNNFIVQLIQPDGDAISAEPNYLVLPRAIT